MSEFSLCNTCNKTDTCALTGAAAFALGISNAKVLVNGPIWCYFYAMRYLEQSIPDLNYCMYNSQPDNQAIVYGTESVILETLNNIKEQHENIDLLFIENSCSLSLIGDDVKGIVAKNFPTIPVVVMDSGGIKGGFAEGYVAAALKILENIEFDIENNYEKSVNLIGLAPFYFNGKADIEEIKRILNLCGYKINVTLGHESSIQSMKKLPNAALNIVLNIELGLSIAEYLNKKFKTPFVCAGMPYGINGTKRWISKIKGIIPCDESRFLEEANRTNNFILAKSNDLSCMWGRLWFDNILVSASNTIAVSMALALRSEWVDTDNLIVITQNEFDSFDYKSDLIDKLLVFSKDNNKIADELEHFKDGLILASSNECAEVNKCKNVCFCHISYPIKDEIQLVDIPFCGLIGSKYMMQRLWNVYIRSKE